MIAYRELATGLVEGLVPAIENLIVLAEIDSTNRLARKLASELITQEIDVQPTLFVAHAQTAGRGRRGNVWLSPAGIGIYASLLWPVAAAAAFETLPLLAAVGLAKALGGYLDRAPVRLKWPNDLVTPDGKLGGLLIEAITPSGQPPEAYRGVAIIGFGLNVEPSGSAPSIATSVAAAATVAPALPCLAVELAVGIVTELAHLGDAAYALGEYEPLSAHRPGDPLRCRVGDETITGTFAGFDPHGFLRLQTGDGERLLSAGEIVEREDTRA